MAYTLTGVRGNDDDAKTIFKKKKNDPAKPLLRSLYIFVTSDRQNRL